MIKVISRKFLEGDLCSGPESLGTKAVLLAETALFLESLPSLMMKTNQQGWVPLGAAGAGPLRTLSGSVQKMMTDTLILISNTVEMSSVLHSRTCEILPYI